MSQPVPEKQLQFRDGAVHTWVDLRVYSVAAAQKAAYRIAERCTVVLGAIDGETLRLTLTFSRPPEETHALEVARLFFRELLDEELREQVGEQTRAMRTLILVHAFSKTDLIDRG